MYGNIRQWFPKFSGEGPITSGFPLNGYSYHSIYSLNRRLISAYSGPLFELTRDVTFTTLDVYADSGTNYVDVSGVASFSGGEICKISKVYDQNTSLNNHAIRATFDNMIDFYDGTDFYKSNDRFNMRFLRGSATKRYLTFTNDIEMADKMAFFVGKTDNVSSSPQQLLSGGATNTQFGLNLDSGNKQLRAVGSPNTIGFPLISSGVVFEDLSVFHMYFESGVGSGVYVNNTLSNLKTTANTTFIFRQVGDRSGSAGTDGFDGLMSELFFLNVSELTNRASLVDVIKEFYQIP